jgi:hypothetical protein
MFKKIKKILEGSDESYIKFDVDKEALPHIPRPVPAGKLMPTWYKKLKPRVEGQKKSDVGTAKACMPMLDSVTDGFIIPLWADVHVRVFTLVEVFAENGNKLTEVEHAGDLEELVGEKVNDLEGQPVVAKATRTGEKRIVLNMPDQDNNFFQTFSDHSWDQVGELCDLKKFALGKALLKFNNPWIITTAPGWSCHFKNPANNWSNDIQLVEARVDTDNYYSHVNFPFVWTGSEDEELIIPKGTPLVHVIPYKRENKPELIVGAIDEKKRDVVLQTLASTFVDRYKRLFWHKRKKD